MKTWYTTVLIAIFLFTIISCSTTATDSDAINSGVVISTTEELEKSIPTLDSIEYWEIVQGEIVTMLNQHNLYVSAISHAYPCVQFYVEPGFVTNDGKLVASGLSHEEYKDVFYSVKEELHIILDKYKLAKPKTIFHGCHSIVDIYFNNWVINENKVRDNVYSHDVACYGLDLLEYYYAHEENSFIQKDAFSNDVWVKYPVFTRSLGD